MYFIFTWSAQFRFQVISSCDKVMSQNSCQGGSSGCMVWCCVVLCCVVLCCVVLHGPVDTNHRENRKRNKTESAIWLLEIQKVRNLKIRKSRIPDIQAIQKCSRSRIMIFVCVAELLFFWISGFLDFWCSSTRMLQRIDRLGVPIHE
jgi:hypothetical protein